jgi:intraflagellar transport protein 56
MMADVRVPPNSPHTQTKKRKKYSRPVSHGLDGLIIHLHDDDREHLKIAQQLFQLVGASASECDTIPGRQCMASCFYLLRNFEDVNVYLNSIKAYLSHDDDFNWNYGLSLAATGNYKAAEVRGNLRDGNTERDKRSILTSRPTPTDSLPQEALLSIQGDRYKAEYAYLAWLSRCCIMNGNPHYAWELYLQVRLQREGPFLSRKGTQTASASASARA